MADWATIGVRFALYANLMLLFGVPLFALYAPGGRDSMAARRGFVMAVSLTGLALSLLSIAVITAAMAGTALTQVDPGAIRMMVTDTPIGHAWAVRIVALVALLALMALPRPMLAAAALLGGVALATLAWTGHGAAGEGDAGMVQLAADIVHLLVAAAWIGAIVGLAAMVVGNGDHQTAFRALDSFSKAGSVIVALVLASGLVNSAYLVGANHLTELPATLYGQLLIAKLALFAAMLGLAAFNRFRLTPALTPADDALPSFAALRRSLTLEAGAATAILALVAWLGTLEPPASM